MSEPTKECRKCNEIKPYSCFRKHRRACKSCESKYHMQYIKTPKGKLVHDASSKRYQQSEKGRKAFAKSQKKWSSTEHGKASNRERSLKSYYRTKEVNEHWLKARRAISCLVKKGEISRANTFNCVLCHSKPAKDYHHVDYNRPLLVFPLCRKCHNYIHKEFK